MFSRGRYLVDLSLNRKEKEDMQIETIVNQYLINDQDI